MHAMTLKTLAQRCTEIRACVERVRVCLMVLLTRENISVRNHIITRRQARDVRDGLNLIASLRDDHADDLLVAVRDEVAAQLVVVLVRLDQLLARHPFQVALARAQHDGHRAEVDVEFVSLGRAPAVSQVLPA